jgi:RND superfamily putative drug exporter
MFTTFGRAIVRNPWKVIAVWLVLLVGSFFAPRLADQVSTDQASFLPSSYESVEAQQLAERAFGQGAGASATIVVKRVDGQPLGVADTERVGELAQALTSAGIDRVAAAATGQQAISPNRQVQLVNIALTGAPADPVLGDAVMSIRDRTAATLDGSGLSYAVTGDVAFIVDNQDAFDTALLVVSIVTLALVVGLLLVIYRSPVAAFLPVVVVGVVSAVSSAVIALFVKAFGMQVDQSLLTILTVVLYGVGTDYIVFLLFRYRERLRVGDAPKEALAAAVSRVGEVIASAAAAIVIAFGALLLAVFGGFRSPGPGLAIGVVVMAIAAVTLVPAIVSLIGTKVFWPSKSWQRAPKGSVFQRLGRFTGRRPAVVALASGGSDGRAGAGRVQSQGRLRPARTTAHRHGVGTRRRGPAGRLPGRCAQPDHRVRAGGRRPAPRPGDAGQLRAVVDPGARRRQPDARARRQSRHDQFGRHGRPDQPAAGDQPVLESGARPGR